MTLELVAVTGVRVTVGVGVAEAVEVAVGDGLGVADGLAVAVGVRVDVGVRVEVGVAVELAVGVGLGVPVGLGVAVRLGVPVGLEVGVAAARLPPSLLLQLASSPPPTTRTIARATSSRTRRDSVQARGRSHSGSAASRPQDDPLVSLIFLFPLPEVGATLPCGIRSGPAVRRNGWHGSFRLIPSYITPSTQIGGAIQTSLTPCLTAVAGGAATTSRRQTTEGAISLP
jgi:hypothetical protein